MGEASGGEKQRGAVERWRSGSGGSGAPHLGVIPLRKAIHQAGRDATRARPAVYSELVEALVLLLGLSHGMWLM